jgi:hypothetical protein
MSSAMLETLSASEDKALSSFETLSEIKALPQ